jgi:mono/diheme cytochrome c family protein
MNLKTLCRSLAVASVAALALGLPASAMAGGPPTARGERQSPPQMAASHAKTPAAIYASACQACHGPDGRGTPQSTSALPLPVPDFSDCNFASREPDGDWLAIIHNGGPARGFDRLMPAFGDALPSADLELALKHVRTFCGNPAWPSGNLNFPRTLFTEKAFVEDEAVITASIAAEGDPRIASKIVYEKRFFSKGQFELVVPLGFKKPEGEDWTTGLGDVVLGWKQVVAHSDRTGSILAVSGEVILPIGDEGAGFGKGVTVFEPFLAFGQALGGDSFIQAQTGIELPTDSEKAAKKAFWRVAVGKSFSQNRWGRSWTPMLEVLGFRELLDGESAHWDLVPQFQVTLNTRQHIIANIGVRIPLDKPGSRSTQIAFYLLWDWFDGGLRDGW